MSKRQLFWTAMLVVNVVVYHISPNPFSILGGVVATGLIIFGRS